MSLFSPSNSAISVYDWPWPLQHAKVNRMKSWCASAWLRQGGADNSLAKEIIEF
jgi:hypothetical protein